MTKTVPMWKLNEMSDDLRKSSERLQEFYNRLHVRAVGKYPGQKSGFLSLKQVGQVTSVHFQDCGMKSIIELGMAPAQSNPP